MNIRVKRLPHGEGLPLPEKATAGAACMDLCAAIQGETILLPGARSLVPTGLVFEVPPGYEAQVRPRSGLALKHGIGVLNSPGTIDSDYRGEVGVILANFGSEPFKICRGDRIAQVAIARVQDFQLVESDELVSTGRGEGGFGHTGR